MLLFSFVLLVATSALAAPGIPSAPSIEYISVDLSEEVGVAKNTGRANHLTDGLFNLMDGGNLSLYIASLQQVVNDSASKESKKEQARALGQAVAMILALGTGIPGDACLSADLINKYTTGNYKKALYNWVNLVAKNLDILIRLRKNPEAARYAIGPVSGCRGGGRTYNLEAAWDAIIANTSANNAELVKEKYCIIKRLYNAFTVASNNVAAMVTAASLPPVTQIIERVYGPLVNFVIAVIENRNTGPTSSALQSALMNQV